jgi:hypothetical protein
MPRPGPRGARAPLELLHIIDRQAMPTSGEDHSGAIGFDAQEKLLDKLSEPRTSSAAARRASGAAFLTRLRERAGGNRRRRGGYRQRYGELEETLLEQEEACA